MFNKNQNYDANNYKKEVVDKVVADEQFFSKIKENYVDEAEQVIRQLASSNSLLTVSSIRNILELINTVREKMVFESETVCKNVEYDIQYILLKLYYIYGRAQAKGKDTESKNTMAFIEKSKIRELVLCVGKDKSKFEIFAKYVEALVAFHKYYGGKD